MLIELLEAQDRTLAARQAALARQREQNDGLKWLDPPNPRRGF